MLYFLAKVSCSVTTNQCDDPVCIKGRGMQCMPLIVYNLILRTLAAKHKKSNYKTKIELYDTHALVCRSAEAFVKV